MIEVEHLSKTYGSTVAIEDVTFRVEPGEILGFLGPNGAGKTTTMRILTGYLPANRGTARIAEYDVHADSMAVRQRIGYLPESPPLYLDMTVEGFLNFVARIKGVVAGDRPQRIAWAMERCNILDKRDVLIRKLSKGYRQRVGIAQAIVHDPPAIILDEPTVGLDPRQVAEVRSLIKSLAGDHTIILSTHILPEVSMTCDRVAIINRGRIIATGSPDSLMEQLSGQINYVMEVAGDAAIAQQTLEAMPQVQAVGIQPDSSLADGHLRLNITTESDVDPGREIAAALVGAGIGLYEMRRIRASLEDVFINLTTQEKAADEAVISSDVTEREANQGVDQIPDPIAQPNVTTETTAETTAETTVVDQPVVEPEVSEVDPVAETTTVDQPVVEPETLETDPVDANDANPDEK